MLEVDSFSKFVHFPAEEIETLAAIAKQAAIIIENARLFEQEQRQRQSAEALVEVLTATASTYSLKKVLIKLCQAVVNLSVGDRCSILMTGEDGRSLDARHVPGDRGSGSMAEIPQPARRGKRSRRCRSIAACKPP